MGQSSSTLEEGMKKRIQNAMDTYSAFEQHIVEANQWATLCPTPRSCRLHFCVLIAGHVKNENLPSIWKKGRNVVVKVQKVRREYDTSTVWRNHGVSSEVNVAEPSQSSIENSSDHTSSITPEFIGNPKYLNVYQFYYVYCFLSDIRDCAAHSLISPMILPPLSSSQMEQKQNSIYDMDELECLICMDKQKEVVLPCTHSFCLPCYRSWSELNQTCPICRTKIQCGEGEDLWQLTYNEASDLYSYASDLVSRIFELLDKIRDEPLINETNTSSKIRSSIASSSIVTAADDVAFITATAVNDFVSKMRNTLNISNRSTRYDRSQQHEEDNFHENDQSHLSDYEYAMRIARNTNQHEAERQIDELRRDHVLALALSMEVEEL